MKYHMFFALVIHTLVFYQRSSARCPATVTLGIRRFIDCLPRYNRITSASRSAINSYCSFGKYTELSCVAGFLRDCDEENSDVGDSVRLLLSVNLLRRSIDTTCRFRNAILRQRSCIRRTAPTVRRCLDREREDYESRVLLIRLLGISRGRNWTNTQLLNARCAYENKQLACFRPYRRNCGNSVGDVFDARMEVNIAPICHLI